MKQYPFDKYDYYMYEKENGAKVIVAVSTYAGKCVRGKAICDPTDNFDLKAGKELAAARCNARVAQKRRDRASAELAKANAAVIEAQRRAQKMLKYYSDANEAAAAAIDAKIAIEQSL